MSRCRNKTRMTWSPEVPGGAPRYIFFFFSFSLYFIMKHTSQCGVVGSRCGQVHSQWLQPQCEQGRDVQTDKTYGLSNVPNILSIFLPIYQPLPCFTIIYHGRGSISSCSVCIFVCYLPLYFFILLSSLPPSEGSQQQNAGAIWLSNKQRDSSLKSRPLLNPLQGNH